MTGGDSGIGRAVAVLLAKESAKAVAIVYLPKEQPVGCQALPGPAGRVQGSAGGAAGRLLPPQNGAAALQCSLRARPARGMQLSALGRGI